MGKFILTMIMAIFASSASAQTCVPSIYGNHIPIFPQASNDGLTTPILVSDKPEYAAFLQSQDFCEACLGGPSHPEIECADFKFDTNITTDSIAACLSDPNIGAFNTKKAVSFTLDDFDYVKRNPYQKCVIRGREMNFEACEFIFKTACAKYISENDLESHPCRTEENYIPQGGGTTPAGEEEFYTTHKPDLDYMLKFYNCPASPFHDPECPTALHDQSPPLTGDCAHNE